MMAQSPATFQPLEHVHEVEGRICAGSLPSGSSRPQAGIERLPPSPVPRGRVKVPMRLVESPHYTDAALSVYIKVKALGLRAEGCTAGIATLASYLGLSPSTVQRGLAQLRAPAPDGIVELPDSRRRSLPGGQGTTAVRRVRPLQRTERFVWLPVTASERLRPRLLRAYAVISYAVVQKIPLTERVLAGFLRHHSGRRAGTAISTDAAGRIVDELVASGWIGVRRRAGFQGRHVFFAHDRPVPATSRPDDRSGPGVGARSLANKEDLMTDRPENDAAPASSAVGEVPVGKCVERRLTPARPAGEPGDRALRAEGKRPPSPLPGKKPYNGPHLTFSGRLHTVLEPVRFLLADVSTYVQRRIGREIARQLDDGTTPARLRARLTQRLAQTSVTDIRDPGRWLLGVALPRWGCANPDCEAGVLWSAGVRCPVCREVVALRATARREGTPPRHAETVTDAGGRRVSASAAPVPVPAGRARSCCPRCERPHHPGSAGLCHACRPRPVPVAAAEPRCRGKGGACGRPAPHGLCWRCRTAAEAGRPSTPADAVPVPGRDAQERPAGVGSRTAASPEAAVAGAAPGAPASDSRRVGTSYPALTMRRSFHRW
ncbi:conserved hypothetical protein [Streptomyces viridosporus ATCC 14672]|uniref:Helix-turn-helix domain-containing protein n=1 Tax=Streptomyces viridosporus (strain ATCC 14672 / DSM 40746 / JCM 4963 / KCTC 9882 / NRRL B-12104 / FH 1290) TaxID=566461 RepID=D6AAF7_STRV1|nr:conserved hypothetical protein [Streptomyces viridosporus ATCC 14672]